MKADYDVIVVGAGPAGSMAARAAAESGLDVLLIEKRPVIGEPVRCGEGIEKNELIKFMDVDKAWVCAEISRAHIHQPDRSAIELAPDHGRVSGYILDRKLFDKALAKAATAAGAEVLVETRATSLILDGGRVSGIRGVSKGKDFEARARVVIAADGIESKLGRQAGIDTTLKPKNIAACAQYLLTDIDVDPSSISLFFDFSYAPGGYAWVFPKGAHTANVGLGVQASRLEDKRPIEYLREFVDERFPGARVLETVAGGIPIGGMPGRLSTGGLMLVGDAAHLVNPLTGAGIANAMFSGKTAGLIAGDAIKAGDTSAAYLFKYDRAMRKTTDWLKGLYRLYAEMEPYGDRERGRALSCLFRALGGSKFYFFSGMLAYYYPPLLRPFRRFG